MIEKISLTKIRIRGFKSCRGSANCAKIYGRDDRKANISPIET